jgi:MarR family transcriptional regulator, organic hydroperoxide resistance regulator
VTEKARKARERTVGQLLFQVNRLVGERMRVKMEGIGLHKAQGFALFFLAHHEGAPQTEIARTFHLSPASVTNMLQRMERDGWIERRPDPDDQRVSRVYLTKKARALQEEADATFHELEAEVTGALTSTEQDQLHGLLLKIHARLIEHLPIGRHPLFPLPDNGGEEL